MSPISPEPLAAIKNFQGLYSRGSFSDCPQDHQTQFDNLIFDGMDVKTRDSIQHTYFATFDIIAFFNYSKSIRSIVPSITIYPMIYMDRFSNVWDAGSTPNLFLHQFAGADGFFALEAFGRIYITPKQQGMGLLGEIIYYYDGTNFLPLAGYPPLNTLTLAQVNVGIVDAGVHAVTVAYQTATGFLTAPSSTLSTLITINSTGANDIEVSNIPIGPAGTVARVLLMTLANQLTFFFVPGGTINDNTTTTAVINVHDSALIASADYLNNVKSFIPSCSSIRFYKGRFIYVGINAVTYDIFQVITSDVGIYDSINQVGNVINIPRGNPINSPSTSAVILNILYVFKPYGTYAMQDNGNNPSTWDVTIVDPALGCYDPGISVFSSGLSGQDVLDVSFVLSPRGLLLFNGNYSDTPLTLDIDNYWKSLDVSKFYISKLCNDIINKRLFIIVGNTLFLLVMDYTNGLTPDTVRWSRWYVTAYSFSQVTTNINQDDTYTTKILMTGVGTVLPAFRNWLSSLDNTQTADFTTNAITPTIQTACIGSKEGSLSTFSGLQLKILGSGKLNFVLTDEEGGSLTASRSINLSSAAYSNSQDITVGINYNNERMMVNLSGDLVTLGSFRLKRINIYGSSTYSRRPSILQST